MKLLIITQKVDIDDDNLGFFHRWLENFAANLEEVHVICLGMGKHRLPANVKIYSLGKERGYSKLRQFFRLQKFLFKHLARVDGVFFHMCPIYAIASFPLVKIFRKKAFLWFLHKSVNWKLRLAEKCVDKILTASEESCRLKNRKKIEIVGHGIDVDKFSPLDNNRAKDSRYQILSVGRISPIKDQETLIKAIDIIVNRMGIKDLQVEIAGSPLEDFEKDYFDKIKKIVSEKKLGGFIEFLGGISYDEIPKLYQNSDLVINLSDTGSIDKVVLEAMAAGSLVLTCNEAFVKILDEKYLFPKKDFENLAKKILSLKSAGPDPALREIVIRRHNLDNLIDKIISKYVQY